MANSNGLYSVPTLLDFSAALLCFFLALWDACLSLASKTEHSWVPLLISLIASSSSSFISLSQPDMPIPYKVSPSLGALIRSPNISFRWTCHSTPCASNPVLLPDLPPCLSRDWQCTSQWVFSLQWQRTQLVQFELLIQLLRFCFPSFLSQHHHHKPFPLPIIQIQSRELSWISSSFSLFISNKFLHIY